MADTVKIRFTRTYQVRDDEGQTFEEGKSYALPEASALHFVRRGAAVIEDPKKKSRGTADEPGAGDAAGA